MSKADKMFKEIGYTNKEYNFNKTIVTFQNPDEDYEISFNLIDKTIEIFEIKNYITMQELQAINEKCKELGWMEE